MDSVRAWLTGVVLLTAGLMATPAQENSTPSSGTEKPGSTEADKVSSEGKKLFSEAVRPTFEQVCLECHGGRRTRSAFDLSTREGLLKGGDNGIDVVLQDSEASRLIKMLRHTEDPGMPYKKHPLDEDLITEISKWIALGTPYAAALNPGEAVAKTSGGDRETLWSVQPLTNAAMPKLASS